MLATQSLPHSLGLLYEELTEHLGFLRSSRRVQGDGAGLVRAARGTSTSCGRRPRHRRRRLPARAGRLGLGSGRRAPADEAWTQEHADLAASVQRVLEEVLLDLARWLHERTGEPRC